MKINEVLGYAVDTVINATVGVLEGVLNSVWNAAKTVIGVGASALSIVTLGKFSKINDVANLTDKSMNILHPTYQAVGLVANPKFSFGEVKSALGVVTARVAAPIFRKAERAAESESFAAREIGARVAYLAGAAVSIATRVADLALGVLAAAFSVVPCLGRAEKVNNFAMQYLLSSAVVHDVCVGLRGFVNPQQFVPLQPARV